MNFKTFQAQSDEIIDDIESSFDLKFLCSFDDYTNLNIDICGGYNYSMTNGDSSISGLKLDNLPSVPSVYITDFTSCNCYLLNFKIKNKNFYFN